MVTAEELAILRMERLTEKYGIDFNIRATDPMIDGIILNNKIGLREKILLDAWNSLPSDGCLNCENKFAFVEERKLWVRYIRIFDRFMHRERSEKRKRLAMEGVL